MVDSFLRSRRIVRSRGRGFRYFHGLIVGIFHIDEHSGSYDDQLETEESKLKRTTIDFVGSSFSAFFLVSKFYIPCFLFCCFYFRLNFRNPQLFCSTRLA